MIKNFLFLIFFLPTALVYSQSRGNIKKAENVNIFGGNIRIDTAVINLNKKIMARVFLEDKIVAIDSFYASYNDLYNGNTKKKGLRTTLSFINIDSLNTEAGIDVAMVCNKKVYKHNIDGGFNLCNIFFLKDSIGSRFICDKYVGGHFQIYICTDEITDVTLYGVVGRLKK